MKGGGVFQEISDRDEQFHCETLFGVLRSIRETRCSKLGHRLNLRGLASQTDERNRLKSRRSVSFRDAHV